jgi:pimeloyl-ACP methyl ester carboxylesterase
MPKRSSERLPIVLVPGLACSARLYSEQIPLLWPFGPVTVADHTRDESIAAIARSILTAAPPRFALVGLSMGGYIAFEIMRQARERVAKLALLDTAATPETPQQTATREKRIKLTKCGRFGAAIDLMFPSLVHRNRRGDKNLKRIVDLMGEEIGADAFICQQHAIMARADSRASLAAITCPTLVVVGDADRLTPPAAAQSIAAGISAARLVVIPQCGHLSTLEQPEALNAALVEWIAP